MSCSDLPTSWSKQPLLTASRAFCSANDFDGVLYTHNLQVKCVFFTLFQHKVQAEEVNHHSDYCVIRWHGYVRRSMSGRSTSLQPPIHQKAHDQRVDAACTMGRWVGPEGLSPSTNHLLSIWPQYSKCMYIYIHFLYTFYLYMVIQYGKYGPHKTKLIILSRHKYPHRRCSTLCSWSPNLVWRLISWAAKYVVPPNPLMMCMTVEAESILQFWFAHTTCWPHVHT